MEDVVAENPEYFMAKTPSNYWVCSSLKEARDLQRRGRQKGLDVRVFAFYKGSGVGHIIGDEDEL